MQIYKNGKDQGFTLVSAIALPEGAGQISFADMDADGTMDLVFPVCDAGLARSSQCSLTIMYNQQKPLCPRGRSGSECLSSQALCTDDNGGLFSGSLHTGPSQQWPGKIQSIFISTLLGAYLGSGEVFKTSDPSLSGLSPLPAVYIGDYDRDGYPDIAFLTQSSRVRVLHSVPSDQEGARRSFQLDKGWNAELDRVPGDILSASWVDLNEDVLFLVKLFFLYSELTLELYRARWIWS